MKLPFVQTQAPNARRMFPGGFWSKQTRSPSSFLKTLDLPPICQAKWPRTIGNSGTASCFPGPELGEIRQCSQETSASLPGRVDVFNDRSVHATIVIQQSSFCRMLHAIQYSRNGQTPRTARLTSSRPHTATSQSPCGANLSLFVPCG